MSIASKSSMNCSMPLSVGACRLLSRRTFVLLVVFYFSHQAIGQEPKENNVISNPAIVRTTPVDGYRGIWYAVGPTDDEFAYKYSGGMGTYCAKHNPFAVYAPKVNKTFFCYGGAKEDTLTSLVHMVSYFDHSTGRLACPRMLLDKKTNDAHDNPVLSMDDQGYIWIFSTSHGVSRPSFIHRSTEPYSIDRFERVEATYGTDKGERPLDNFSYLQVWRSPQHGFAAFFTHYHDPADRTSMFMTSKNGRQWSPWTRIAAIEKGHYQISAVCNSKVGAAFNYHPKRKGLNFRTNLYYVQSQDALTWTNVAGDKVELPITSSRNQCLVYDFEREKKLVYLKDIAYDQEQRPVVLVVTSQGHQSGPSNDPRTWELFRWRNGEWLRSKIATSDSNYDFGSLFIEQDSWRLIAPTTGKPQAYNPGGEMTMWVSRDEGNSWEFERQLTNSSQLNHTYARKPVNAHPGFYSVWADGHGRRPSQSRLYFCNRNGDTFQMPIRMKKGATEPINLAAGK